MDFQVLIVGGGIHGVGLLHDLATRRVRDVLLVEGNSLASGTSSRSTKLVHGGLRYLEHFGQWGLVREALLEREILLRVLRGVVQPLPFVLPVVKGGRPAWMLRSGLFLYDLLAGDGGMPASRSLSKDDLRAIAPYIRADKLENDIEKAFLYYDAQMLDDVIVRVAAAAAQKLGATLTENTRVTSVRQRAEGGFTVQLQRGENGHTQEVTARFVINAAGAWCNANLLRWGHVPKYATLLNLGSHLVLSSTAVRAKASDCAATLFQHTDGRAVFFIPWNNRWLLGTTESVLEPGEPRSLRVPDHDRAYLLDVARSFLAIDNPESHIEEAFCGVRTMPFQAPVQALSKAQTDLPLWQAKPFESPFYVHHSTHNISALSRETVIDEVAPGLLSIYGGKYTTYRAQCEKIGALLCRRMGLGGVSGTQDMNNWFISELFSECPSLFQSAPSVRQL